MYCNQCEQTARGIACTTHGVCGKNPEIAALLDLLVHALQGLSLYAREGRQVGVADREVSRFTVQGLFTTVTNVDFDPARYQVLITEAAALREQLKGKVARAGGKVNFDHPSAAFKPAADIPGLVEQGKKVSLESNKETDADIQSLQRTLLFGIKGVAAYTDHARILGQEDEKVYAFINEALAALTEKHLLLSDWLGLVLKCGEINLRAMELLDAANTGTYGHPVPTQVPLGHKQGECILISGHDLKGLAALLEQTAGKGITVYTHGEMLPVHGYPELKKHSHFYEHFGTAWQNQQKEFAAFPGAILMTTNCLQKPQAYPMPEIFLPPAWSAGPASIMCQTGSLAR